MSWEYIAGFFDGEGCLSRTNKSSPHKYYVISISQKNKHILDEIRKFVGYGQIYQDKTKYQYKITKQEYILDFLSAIAPYVIVKKAKVYEVLENPWKRQYRWKKVKQIQY